ncbi:hypothetical protein SCUCBS95973_008365 [Sporothrix curviconia]|uniref:Xylanolytic transcriptional activator regulatory domain-containing protein n=1 Tax=Sporothrix curviconia TaxID=1260050 RepID=A0ABP0CKY3_9PEZI
MHFSCAYAKPSYAYAAQIAAPPPYPPAYAQLAPGLQEQLQEQLAAIDARVAALTQAVFQNGQTFAVAPPTGNAKQQQQQQQQPTYNGQPVSVSPDGCYLSIDDGGQDADVDAAALSEERNDGMEAIVFTEEEDAGFFGPSSNIAFTRHISRALARMSAREQSQNANNSNGNGPENGSASSNPSPAARTARSLQLDGSIMSVSRAPSPRRRPRGDKDSSATTAASVNIYLLPDESVIRDLVSRYFANTGMLFPYIHEASFWATYEELKRHSFTQVRRTWLGLLNMVLALAASSAPYDKDAATRAHESDVYYQRARQLCGGLGSDMPFSLKNASLETVQHHLLMSQYLQGTQKSIQAWPVHGLAVKAAFQLGLHSSETSYSSASLHYTPLEREVRKRTWYGCVVLDRTLSMTFGRPAAIPDQYVRLPLPTDVDWLPSLVPTQDVAKQTSVVFFNSTISLYKIMWSTIDILYDGNTGCSNVASSFDLVGQILGMERQLAAWRRALPATLVLISAGDVALLLQRPGSPPFDIAAERFRLILTLRHLNLRILINRPILVRFLEAGSGTEDDTEVLEQNGLSSVRRCVQASVDILDIVHTIIHGPKASQRLLGSWWFTLYYSFNAALVLFAASFVPVSGESTSPNVLRTHLDKAVDTLRHFERGNRMVERCSKYLERLGRVLDVQLALSSSLASPPFSSQGPQAALTAAAAQSQSPLDIDLGELLTETDFAFLSQFTMPMDTGDGSNPFGMM